MQVECVKLLLEAGANIKAFAMDDMNAMHFAAQKGHAEVVRQLLNAGQVLCNPVILMHSFIPLLEGRIKLKDGRWTA